MFFVGCYIRLLMRKFLSRNIIQNESQRQTGPETTNGSIDKLPFNRLKDCIAIHRHINLWLQL